MLFPSGPDPSRPLFRATSTSLAEQVTASVRRVGSGRKQDLNLSIFCLISHNLWRVPCNGGFYAHIP